MTAPPTLRLRLKKPLARGIRELKLLDPTISDLAGLITGVKPVTYTDYSESDWPYIKGLCDALGLVYSDPEAAAARRGKHLGAAPGGRRMLLLAKKPGPLKAATAAWGKSAIDRDWGILLGYPECCVDAYIRWRTGFHEKKDLVRFTAENTPAGEPWDFRLNNIVNYFSRVYGADERQSRLISDLNQRAGLLISIAHVASWHSCSYLCRESSKKAAAIFGFFEEYAPAYAAGLKRLLARPFLFVDKYDFLPLEKKAGAGWTYAYPALPLGLLPPARAAALKSAGALELAERGLKLGGSTLKTGAAPIILNFSSRNL
ncbi:MAG: hypothetical protein PHV33_04145 [Elusimicrobiales bacterium]|nr:hypothetical protein [Elusimicrobiales bacterium]